MLPALAHFLGDRSFSFHLHLEDQVSADLSREQLGSFANLLAAAEEIFDVELFSLPEELDDLGNFHRDPPGVLLGQLLVVVLVEHDVVSMSSSLPQLVEIMLRYNSGRRGGLRARVA
jgi:hypothetical protein